MRYFEISFQNNDKFLMNENFELVQLKYAKDGFSRQWKALALVNRFNISKYSIQEVVKNLLPFCPEQFYRTYANRKEKLYLRDLDHKTVRIQGLYILWIAEITENDLKTILWNNSH
jgi:hypothetical protein